jgi:hypothetical protein
LSRIIQRGLTIGICLVWLTNGLFCKVMNLVPRHQAIVSRILGASHSGVFTKAIGVAETIMVVWIVSGIKSRWCALFQMAIVATMNVVEFFIAPDLLLFGRLNIVLAFLFILIIYINEFVLGEKKPYNVAP